MRPKFQKRSVLKLAGRIIPEAKRSGVSETKISKAKPIEISKSNE